MFKNAGRVKRTIEEYFFFRWSDWYCGRFERHYADNPWKYHIYYQYGTACAGIYFSWKKFWNQDCLCQCADVSWVKCSGEMVPNVCATHLTAGAGTDLCDRASGGEFSHLI